MALACPLALAWPAWLHVEICWRRVAPVVITMEKTLTANRANLQAEKAEIAKHSATRVVALSGTSSRCFTVSPAWSQVLGMVWLVVLFLVCLVCVCVFCLVALFGLLPPRVRSFISFELCANSMQSWTTVGAVMARTAWEKKKACFIYMYLVGNFKQRNHLTYGACSSFKEQHCTYMLFGRNKFQKNIHMFLKGTILADPPSFLLSTCQNQAVTLQSVAQNMTFQSLKKKDCAVQLHFFHQSSFDWQCNALKYGIFFIHQKRNMEKRNTAHTASSQVIQFPNIVFWTISPNKPGIQIKTLICNFSRVVIFGHHAPHAFSFVNSISCQPLVTLKSLVHVTNTLLCPLKIWDHRLCIDKIVPHIQVEHQGFLLFTADASLPIIMSQLVNHWH